MRLAPGPCGRLFCWLFVATPVLLLRAPHVPEKPAPSLALRLEYVVQA